MDRIIGHVDGFVAGLLQGWVTNLNNPAALERLTIHDGVQPDFEICSHFYRGDVCRVHNIEGLFGFAIKREWLDAKSVAVTISNRNGMPLTGGVGVPLPEALPPRPQRDGLDIFLHLAKTAGTSVRHVMAEQLNAAEMLLVYPGPGIGLQEAFISRIPLQQRRRLRLVIGHCSFGIHERLDVPSRYSVFLRHPAARLQSNFAHHGAARTVFRVDGTEINLVTTINEGLTEDFDNLMVRVIAGLSKEMRPLGTVSSADVDLALNNLRTHFKFVGLQETMEESFAGLCGALGLNATALPRENVTPVSWMGADNQLASVDWAAVHHRNRFDLALYDAVIKDGLVGRIG